MATRSKSKDSTGVIFKYSLFAYAILVIITLLAIIFTNVQFSTTSDTTNVISNNQNFDTPLVADNQDIVFTAETECREFAAGTNLAWLNGGYGADFATIEEWGQHTYDAARTEEIFQDMQANGMNMIRWWVFADGRGAPNYTGNQQIANPPYNSRLPETIIDALTKAEQYDIDIMFNLWSFDMAEGESDWANNGNAGNFNFLIENEQKLNSYIDEVLVPLFNTPIPGTSYTIATHPNTHIDIFNEPEFLTEDKRDPETGELIRFAIYPDETVLQRFVALQAGALRRIGAKNISVGSGSLKWLGGPNTVIGGKSNFWADSELTRFDSDGYLDYYQVHYYGWMDGDGVNWNFNPFDYSFAQLNLDKPLVIGEYAAISSNQLLQQAFDLGYAGALAWAYEDIDAAGNISNSRQAYRNFSNNNCYSRLNGDGSQTGSTTGGGTTGGGATGSGTGGNVSDVELDLIAGFGNDWQNWSWDSDVLKQGTSLNVNFQTAGQGNSALFLHSDTPVNDVTGIEMSYSNSSNVLVALVSGENTEVCQRVSVSGSRNNQVLDPCNGSSVNGVTGLWILADNNTGQINLSELKLLVGNDVVQPTPTPTSTPTPTPTPRITPPVTPTPEVTVPVSGEVIGPIAFSTSPTVPNTGLDMVIDPQTGLPSAGIILNSSFTYSGNKSNLDLSWSARRNGVNNPSGIEIFETDLTSTKENVVVKFTEAGNYRITLTVTDGNTTEVETLDVLVNSAGTPTGNSTQLHVENISGTSRSIEMPGTLKFALESVGIYLWKSEYTITVHDENSDAISGVCILGRLDAGRSRANLNCADGSTNAAGQVTLEDPGIRVSFSFLGIEIDATGFVSSTSFRVNNLQKDGYEYDKSANSVTNHTVTFAAP